MKTNVNQILDDLKKDELDKPLATLLIAQKSDKLYFIGEALLIGAGLFLLEKYLSGLLGDKLEKLGGNHKEKLKSFWRKVIENKKDDDNLNEYNKELQSILVKLKPKEISKIEIDNAEFELIALLINCGAAKKQAVKVAKAMSKSIFHGKL